ncbi:MAG: vanadium-dependent haloperoxidase [Agriterribacter sp.]
MRKAIFFLAIISIGFGCANKQKKSIDISPDRISDLIGEMSQIMIHDVSNPPLAARFFSYTCLSGYEIISQNDTAFKSMHRAVNNYPLIKKPDSVVGNNYQLAAILAMIQTAKKMQPSGKRLETFEQTILKECRSKGLSDEDIADAQKYAGVVSKAVLAYARADNYIKISNLQRYAPLEGEQYWYPTPPAYMPAVEPHFNTVRPFLIDSANQFVPPPPVPYSRDKHSAFYKMLEENYKQGEATITDEHKQIAAFWDCNPFAVQDDGHMMVGLKKISPGAHWLGITGIACKNAKKSFNESLFIHTAVAMGLMDSFIGCWNEKYYSNRVRPETAVRNIIDPHWKPLLQTPPFPEYLSGHSCISSTSQVILSHYIGSNIPFKDTVEVSFGLPSRTFQSFKQAAAEAAISRFYGGIHYMDAIDNGLVQGEKIGNYALNKLKGVF